MSRKAKHDYESCLAAGMSLQATADHFGVDRMSVWSYARQHDLDYATKRAYREDFRLRTTVDNAVSAAFRAVLGRCPFRDPLDEKPGKALPKQLVTLDPVFGTVPLRKGKK